jgi:DNA-binding CsgD family transcriptional regulator
MDDEQDRSFCVGEGSPYIYGSLAGLGLDLKSYLLFYHAKEDLRLDRREHLLARLTPGEVVYMEYICRHPEQSDAEVRRALKLHERTVLSYFTHLYRNFKIGTTADFRDWAFKNHLVPMPNDGPLEDAPVEDKPVDPAPDPGFNPWVRWY